MLMLVLTFVSPFAACGALYRNAWIGQLVGLLIGIVVGIAVQMLLLCAMGLGILPMTSFSNHNPTRERGGILARSGDSPRSRVGL